MIESEKIRKIAVSEKTFSQMSEELIECLKTKEKVLLFVIDDSLMCERKMLMNEKIDGIILSKEEEKELELVAPEMPDNVTLAKQIEEMNKVFEMKDVPEVIMDYQRVYERPKQKYYVPHTIGKPNSKKKGSR